MKNLFGVNILIATPGRLLELLRVNALSISKVKHLVIDEADKMLNIGFKEEMDEIVKLLPEKRQNLLFSATLSEKVKEINQLVLTKPIIVKIKAREEKIDLIQQEAYFILNENKGPLLRYIIKSQNIQQVLIFTSSKFISVAMTLTPSDAKTFAVASPIPLPAPVIIATLPFTDLESFLKNFIFKVFELLNYL